MVASIDLDRDGIPLRFALPRLLPIPMQFAIVLAQAAAANELSALGKHERVSALRTLGNPKIEAPLIVDEITDTRLLRIDTFLRLAIAIGLDWLLGQLTQGKVVAYGEMGNPLDERKSIPSHAWKWRGGSRPAVDFDLGFASHPHWKPPLVQSIMLVDMRCAPNQATEETSHGSRPRRRSKPKGRDKRTAYDHELIDRAMELHAAGIEKAASRLAECVVDEYARRGGALSSRQTAIDRLQRKISARIEEQKSADRGGEQPSNHQ